jgi:hypothetical protein
LCSCIAGFTALACANASSSSEAARAVSPPAPAPHQQAVPQQVVQRIAPANPPPAAPTPGAEPTGNAGAKDPSERTARAPRSEAVTAKHVEAELNRLEAELK